MPSRATFRRAAFGTLVPLAVAWCAPAGTQTFLPSTLQSQSPNPVCSRLEAQLAAINRGAVDPARAAVIKRYEDAVNKQQSDLDRAVAQQRNAGCQRAGGLFSLFAGPMPAQCNQINAQVDQMRQNLDRTTTDYQRAQAGNGEDESQRQTVLAALAQNNCGPQYRAAMQPRGFLDSLFNNSPLFGNGDGSTYRTLCVRTCDGYYYPISFATTQARFRDDEEVCRNTCPGAEVALYSHRNPGGDIQQATAANGRLYTELPNAFRYRQQYDPTCSCRKAGQNWADSMSGTRDATVERGDIVVTDQNTKSLSQPARTPVPPRSRPADPKATGTTPGARQAPAQASAPADAPSADAPAPPRQVRTVGPAPYPVRER